MWVSFGALVFMLCLNVFKFYFIFVKENRSYHVLILLVASLKPRAKSGEDEHKSKKKRQKQDFMLHVAFKIRQSWEIIACLLKIIM